MVVSAWHWHPNLPSLASAALCPQAAIADAGTCQQGCAARHVDVAFTTRIPCCISQMELATCGRTFLALLPVFKHCRLFLLQRSSKPTFGHDDSIPAKQHGEAAPTCRQRKGQVPRYGEGHRATPGWESTAAGMGASGRLAGTGAGVGVENAGGQVPCDHSPLYLRRMKASRSGPNDGRCDPSYLPSQWLLATALPVWSMKSTWDWSQVSSVQDRTCMPTTLRHDGSDASVICLLH